MKLPLWLPNPKGIAELSRIDGTVGATPKSEGRTAQEMRLRVRREGQRA